MELHGYNILPVDGEAWFFKDFFQEEECNLLYSSLFKNIKWEQKELKMYGKILKVPRMTAWYGDEGKDYTYSGIAHHPMPWTRELLQIKSRVEAAAGTSFNSVLLNLYRDGNDSVDWHKDNEKELGINPVIASVSFGGSRKFKLKHDHSKKYKVEIELTNGSLLLMKGTIQDHWFHSIPKTAKPVEPRINMTFRKIV